MITIVIGKPGSGKSYDTVRNLLRILENDVKRGEIRRVYTNLPLNVKGINDYLSKKLDKKIDVSSSITLLNNDFFTFDDSLVTEEDYVKQGVGNSTKKRVRDESKGYWWNRFEDNALIIIDEIQKYLHNSTKQTTSATLAISMYFSTHRHHRHEIILITQALTTLSTEVRKYAEQVKEVFNSKSMTIPFPFNINGHDLDILRAGFGIESQVYRVKTGILTPGNAYRPQYEGDVEVLKTDKQIYACYTTHTKTQGKSRTDVDLPFKVDKYVKFRAVGWFLRKNAFNFGWKIAALVFLALFARFFFFEFCPALTDNFFDFQIPVASDKTKTPLDVEIVETRQDKVAFSSKIASEPVPTIALDSTNITCYSPFGVVCGAKFYGLGDILPGRGRLRQVNVTNRQVTFDDPQVFYFSAFALVDFCGRLSLSTADQNAD